METAGSQRIGLPHSLRTALVFAAALAVVLVWVVVVLAANGVVTEANAASLGAAVAAVVAVFSLAFKLLTDEVVRAQSEIRSRQAMALALHAEISSNLDQQRRTLDPDDVRALIRRKLGTTPDDTAGAIPDRPRSEHSASLADRRDPIFAKAVERYDLVPPEAIHAVIAYYNLNQMMNDVVVLIGSTGFLDLDVDQRRTVLRSYYVLVERVDAKACEALGALAHFVARHRIDHSPVVLASYQPQTIAIGEDERMALGWPRGASDASRAEPGG